MKDEYTEKLEEVIKRMLIPLKNIPFSLVIEVLSGYKVLPFDKNNKQDILVLKTLKKVAKEAGVAINENGILSRRANEVGNYIESFVRVALAKEYTKAGTPITRSGRKKSTGYPDLQFYDEFGRAHYLECKTFNQRNRDTTQRSFYLSPSTDFKITQDAHHFILSYESYVDGRQGNKSIYKCHGWKILSISNLDVDVKYEFNSDNVRLYSEEHLLAEGRFR